MRSRLPSIVLVTLALLAGPATATEDEERAAAKAAFDEGTQLFERNDFSAALARFEAAQAIRPHDKVRIPIATCLERLARFREAIQQWRVVATSEQVDPDERAEAERAIERLTPRLARLAVQGGPTDAEVLVDDELFCRLPCEPAFDPGEHLITIRTPDDEQTQRIRVERGERYVMPWRRDEPVPQPLGSTGPLDGDDPVGTTTGRPTSSSVMAEDGGGPTALTWVGAGLAGVGVAGIIGFGVHANAKHDEYVAAPSETTRDQGVLARNLSNASIAVAAAGAVLVVIDLVFLASWESEPATSFDPARMTFRF